MSLNLDLNNAEYWRSLYQGTLNAQVVDGGKGYLPIPPFTIPTAATSRILLIESTSQDAQPYWRRGGWCEISLPCQGSAILSAEIASYPIPLNRGKLIILPVVAEAYLLKISVSYWLESLSVKAYEYIGEYTDRIESQIKELENYIQLLL